MKIRLTVYCLYLISMFSLVSAGELELEVRSAVKKSLPYLWSEGQSWIDKRGCVSCHQIPFMVWSLNAASKKDFQVDKKRLQDLKEWSVAIDHFINPKKREQAEQSEEKTATANIDTMGQLLLAIEDPQSVSKGEWNHRFAKYLIDAQSKTGTWKPCGQLPFQKRPKRETTAVTTYWTSYALRVNNPTVSLNHKVVIGKDTEQIKGVSTEWWAVQLLLAQQKGDSKKVRQLQGQILESQQEDGGWGWLVEEESDAFGSGIAIYALLKSGLHSESEEVNRAVKFLIESQKSDGAWDVRSTKGKHQKVVTPTASYWGTSWAVIGLLETIE